MNPVAVVLFAAYLITYLAVAPILARAVRAERITRRQYAVLRAARWASIAVVVFAVAGQLLTPLALAFVVGMFAFSAILTVYFMELIEPDGSTPTSR